jgi:hypothetical protein
MATVPLVIQGTGQVAKATGEGISKATGGKGGTALLIGLTLFTGYLFLTGKLEAVAAAIAGTKLTPDVNKPVTTKGEETGPVIKAPPPPNGNVPSTGFVQFSVPHAKTGKPVNVRVVEGPGCLAEAAALLVAGGGYKLGDASAIAAKHCKKLYPIQMR